MAQFKSLALSLITLWFAFHVLKRKRKELSCQFPPWLSKTRRQHLTQCYTLKVYVIDLLNLFLALVTTRIFTDPMHHQGEQKTKMICPCPGFFLPICVFVSSPVLTALSYGISWMFWPHSGGNLIVQCAAICMIQLGT